jgi:hypothetical protein
MAVAKILCRSRKSFLNWQANRVSNTDRGRLLAKVDRDPNAELVDYSRRHKVGIWFWKHSKDRRTPEARRQFFKLCQDVGVVGAKIDFFDHEAKEIIDVYQVLLQESFSCRVAAPHSMKT